MAVSVGNRVLHRAGLSEVARLVLGLIDGGAQWLDWAMTDVQTRYHFRDENALLAAVQSGVHGSPLMLLPRLGLLVSPAKLMTLSAADLRLLARVEMSGEGAASDTALKASLDANGIVTQQALADGVALSFQLGVGTAPVFQAMGLNEQLALLELQRDLATQQDVDPSSSFHKEAASFAAARAQNPFQFVDYFRTCLVYWQVGTSSSTHTDGRADAMVAAMGTLMPLTFVALDGPSVQDLSDPQGVIAAIQNCLMMGRSIGFSRSSLVLQQVITNGGYAGQTGEQAETLVHNFLARAQSLLSASEVAMGQLGQDGATRLFRVETATDRADVELSPTGVITLRSFGATAAGSHAATSTS